MRSRVGLTLIELLISITLGMVLLAMCSSALVQITQVAKRDTAQRQAHDDIAMLHRHLSIRLGAMYHGAQTRVEAHPGVDETWGTGDEIISLTWMAGMRDREERALNLDDAYGRSLVWNRIQWEGDGEGGGKLLMSVSSPERTVSYSGSSFTNKPQWRRDRRRHMNDNDGRWVTGMTKTIVDAIKLPGDAEDLDDNLLRMHPPTTEISDVAFEWIDADGVIVRCDQDGITVDGTTPPFREHLGVIYSGSKSGLPASDPDYLKQFYVVDGTYVDGRNPAYPDAAGVLRTISGQRPSLISLNCTVIPTSASGLPLEQEPHLPFSLTFAATPQLPKL